MQPFGFFNGLGPPFHIQFFKQAGGVCFDGIQGDEKLVGNFLVGGPCCYPLQYFHFPLADAEPADHFRIG